MTHKQNFQPESTNRGFSLLELLIVVGIIMLVMGGILTQIDQAQQRSVAEQGKVDDFQQARDFMDQIFRDSRQMGYPNIRDFDTSVGAAWQSPVANDKRVAVGLIKLTATELDFEGDVDGSGVVSVVSYKINGTGTCATCIQRAQVAKINGSSPLAQVIAIPAASYAVEVQNVQNIAQVFWGYDLNGALITLPVDITNNPTTVPKVRTIQAQLKIASPSAVDPKTSQQIEADIEGRVQVVNCSMATTGLPLVGQVQLTCQ